MLLIKGCPKCKQLLGIGSFYKCKTKKTGLQSYCKTCASDSFKYYRGTPHGKAAHLKRGLTACRTDSGKESARRMRKKYPEKYKARHAVNNALRSGELEKKPCEVCGELKVEGHHLDYSKPLDVQWLCPKHHRELHKQLRGKEESNHG